MEKKRYNRPKVKNTKMDYSINIQLVSANSPAPGGGPNDVPQCPPNEICFVDPFKWFK